MRNIIAVFKKQLKDTLKNKTVLIQFVLFPALTVLMNSVSGASNAMTENLTENFFVYLFTSMYIGMAPLVSMASIVAEEKEKNTLRVLIMSNVKPREYLFGAGFYVWLFCMVGSCVICAQGGFDGRQTAIFLALSAAGIICSVLIGAAVGTWSKSQMAATSASVPVMLIFSFLPMLSMFNSTAEKLAKLSYSGQINIMMNQIKDFQPDFTGVAVIAANMLAAMCLFAVLYKKCSLAD